MRPTKAISATKFQRAVGAAIWAATNGDYVLVVTSHRRPVAVLIDKREYDEYVRLKLEQGMRERVERKA